jgi:hypothetical protein
MEMTGLEDGFVNVVSEVGVSAVTGEDLLAIERPEAGKWKPG